MVDRPPTPPPTGKPTAPAGSAPKAAATPTAAPVQAVADRFVVPEGTLVVVRLAADVSSATAHVGDRVQGFLDQDLAANGRLVAPRGAKVYGVVSAVDNGSKMRGQATLSVTLTDMQVGDKVLTVKTAATRRSRSNAKPTHACSYRSLARSSARTLMTKKSQGRSDLLWPHLRIHLHWSGR
jgi:hypothetical protein